MDIALEVRQASFRFDSRVIFHDLSFRLSRGHALLVVGGSGSGKSLLLRICAGLIYPDQGSVILGGVDLKTARKAEIQDLRARIGYVFQDSALISNMAIYDNIALPLRYHRKWTEEQVRARVEEEMERFGVNRSFDWSIPALLSQEMRKRAGLARALVLDPEFLFLDQPAGGLETEIARDLGRIIRDYSFDRIGLLEGGRIAFEGTVQEMETYWEKGRKPGNSKFQIPNSK
jgi:phospholipid/cholesterol/gamma-HCH transport system ATP-binding protein